MARLSLQEPWRGYVVGMGDALRRSQRAMRRHPRAVRSPDSREVELREPRRRGPLSRLALGLVRRAVFGLDTVQRRRHHVIEFTDDERCILRISRTRAHADWALSDGAIIRAGDPVIEIHYWNERVPEMPPDGPNLTWAVRFNACFRASLEDIAALITTREEWSDAVAIFGETSFATDQERQSYMSLGQRMGFDLMPAHVTGPTGRLAAFFISLYVWIIIWAVHPAGVRGKAVVSAERTVLWMSRAKLMRKYGKCGRHLATANPDTIGRAA